MKNMGRKSSKSASAPAYGRIQIYTRLLNWSVETIGHEKSHQKLKSLV